MSDQWNLNDIYTGFDSEEFQADLKSCAASVEKLNQMSAGMSTFDAAAGVIEELERFIITASRAGMFSGIVFSTDTSNTEAIKYQYKLEEMRADTSRMQVRLAMFLAKLAETEDVEKLAEARGLGEYTYQIQRMIEDYKHLLSENEETLAAKLSATGSSAWAMLHDKLISTLTCDYADPKQNGAVRTITINECRNLAYDADARVRKAAYEAETAAYPKIAEASAAAINGIKGEVNTLSKLRGYARPIDQTLEKSAMTQKTLDAMFAAMDENMQLFRDYLKAKADYLSRKLGIPYNGLPFYDLFAPVGAESDKEFTYDDAKTFVYDNFSRFSSSMAETAKRAFDESWIDVYPREGKRSGAFCADVYAVKQFRILLNFGNNIGDAVTLAHELGHGYHSMNSMRERVLNADYPMPLAETASTFCENVVNNAAMAVLPDEQKLLILEGSVQGSTQVIVDIYSRYLFEKSVFETRLDHPLSVDELNGLMLDAQNKAYGDGLDPDYMHKYMWVIKPHYYSGDVSFYNFPYAFGNLLANGLYKIYEADPGAFGAKYDGFLRNTGKMSIKDACATLGIDVEDKAFWRGAMDVISEQIKQFIELTKK